LIQKEIEMIQKMILKYHIFKDFSIHKIVEKFMASFNTLQTQSENCKNRQNQLQIVVFDIIQ
jgi:hypothetical protein